MEFSKKMLVLHICISVLLCITTIVGRSQTMMSQPLRRSPAPLL